MSRCLQVPEFPVTRQMDGPVPKRVLSALRGMREEMLRHLEELKSRRPNLELQLRTLGESIKSEQRQLELVEAIERQLAGQGRGQPDPEGGGPGASTQVRCPFQPCKKSAKLCDPLGYRVPVVTVDGCGSPQAVLSHVGR
jgi:hypothetical protein